MLRLVGDLLLMQMSFSWSLFPFMSAHIGSLVIILYQKWLNFENLSYSALTLSTHIYYTVICVIFFSSSGWFASKQLHNEFLCMSEFFFDQHALAYKTFSLLSLTDLKLLLLLHCFRLHLLMYRSSHVTCCLVLIPCCQVVGEAGREEHPSVWHAGGSCQSGGSDCSERREERLGSRQSLGEGLPLECKNHIKLQSPQEDLFQWHQFFPFL